MRVGDYIILGLIMTWLVLVVIRGIKKRGRSGCESCGKCQCCMYANRNEKCNEKCSEKRNNKCQDKHL